ncbi:MAG: hypothetical protein PVJ07_00125 [Anaerolineales bacterium]|jgi:hypothetical protein
MQTYLNQRLVRRNALIGKIMVGSGLAVMAVGLLVSCTRPEEVNTVLLTALVGVFASQIGLALVNRWARGPRVDEILSDMLKGLDKRFALFHYVLSADHVLIGPFGVLALAPQLAEGEIRLEQGKWTALQERRGLRRGIRRRNLGAIERAAQLEATSLKKRIDRLLPDKTAIEVQAVHVFMHPEATITVDQSPTPAVHVKKLKSWIRNLPKGKTLSSEELKELAHKAGF